MNRSSTRIPIAATLLLGVTFAGFGWHNHLRLTVLQAEQVTLAAQAAARGMVFDPAEPSQPIRLTKRQRVDPQREAKRVAAELIAASGEVAAISPSLDRHAYSRMARQLMMEPMEQVMALSGEQLKMLIDDLRAAGGAGNKTHDGFIYFAILRLTQSHPEDALAWITDSPEMMELITKNASGSSGNGIAAALSSWTKTDPAAAIEWFHRNGGQLPDTLRDSAKTALVIGAARNDPRQALKFIRDCGEATEKSIQSLTLGSEPEVMGIIMPQEDRLALLSLFSEWKESAADDGIRPELIDSRIGRLAFGERGKPEGFDFTTQWIDRANLTTVELESITQDLSGKVSLAETGRWVDWLGKNLPPAAACDRVTKLVEAWTTGDYKAAGEWLATAPDSSVKLAAVRAYVETMAKQDPEAAAAFAKEHGLKD